MADSNESHYYSLYTDSVHRGVAVSRKESSALRFGSLAYSYPRSVSILQHLGRMASSFVVPDSLCQQLRGSDGAVHARHLQAERRERRVGLPSDVEQWR